MDYNEAKKVSQNYLEVSFVDGVARAVSDLSVRKAFGVVPSQMQSFCDEVAGKLHALEFDFCTFPGFGSLVGKSLPGKISLKDGLTYQTDEELLALRKRIISDLGMLASVAATYRTNLSTPNQSYIFCVSASGLCVDTYSKLTQQ